MNRNMLFFFCVFLCLFVLPASAKQSCSSKYPEATPTSRFSISSDGLVTDKKTGLIWKRCAEGSSGIECRRGSSKKYTWQEAKKFASNHRYLGYDDWRLPTFDELYSLRETMCYNPTINLEVFPNTTPNGFWSSVSNPNPHYSTKKVLYFFDGDSGWKDQKYGSYVRLVREGHTSSVQKNDNKSEGIKYKLTVNVKPQNAEIKIMNIRQKYKPGINLPIGKYDIFISHPDYQDYRVWVEIIDKDFSLNADLKSK